MPKRIFITIIILILFSAKAIYCQGKAFIYVNEKHSYPYEESTKEAQKNYIWLINGKAVKYYNGKYEIKVNAKGQFDTILFQNIYKKTVIYHNHKRHIKDTVTTVILCKFRDNHNYDLTQTYMDRFEIFSLDTFETQKTITFKVINKNDSDTLYLNTWFFMQTGFFSDTTLHLSTENEKMDQSFVEHVALVRNKRKPVFDGPVIPNNDVFDFSFLYLHAENLEIEYDCATQQYRLRLLN